ncbi:hypothetical protein VNO78_19741 [Psophocarpus tetragonolobus]|uniref:Uncharacterized protein n=1 Tax=Psophocarpus tetragonolobus TaxID=3891 RepID=A0AAN9XG39_PSOTE
MRLKSIDVEHVIIARDCQHVVHSINVAVCLVSTNGAVILSNKLSLSFRSSFFHKLFLSSSILSHTCFPEKVPRQEKCFGFPPPPPPDTVPTIPVLVIIVISLSFFSSAKITDTFLHTCIYS